MPEPRLAIEQNVVGCAGRPKPKAFAAEGTPINRDA
jgi:hypothetical protein